MTESLYRDLLIGTDYEVIPLKGTLEKTGVIEPGATVSITASPSRGITATVDLALALQDQGFRAVPHISARMIEDRHHLASVIKRLDDGGVTQVFITGGDGQPQGDYFDALSLIRDMADLGHPFLELGITGYPEGHPDIPDGVLRQAMLDKQEFATYIVTQMCFNPRTIVEWIRSLRTDGVDLPVKAGVPGAVDPARLLAISARIGVGNSMRYLAKNRRVVLRILRPGRYRPDRLIKPLARMGEGLGLTGTHLFTFNQVAPTVAWHHKAMGRIP